MTKLCDISIIIHISKASLKVLYRMTVIVTPFDLVAQTFLFLIWKQRKSSPMYYYLYVCQILQ